MQLWAGGEAVSDQNPEKWPLEANLFLTLSIHFAAISNADSESFKIAVLLLSGSEYFLHLLKTPAVPRQPV